MKKKLPGVYPGKVKKNSGNNKQIFYSEKQEEKHTKENTIPKQNNITSKYTKNIYQKINEILNSPNYIYKADVIITLKTGEIEKRIIGRNHTHLITIENELIPIIDILNIKLKNK